MATFKLLVGQHIQADPDSPALTPEQVKAGARRPSKTYKEGETVESEDDLVAKHGAAKFVLLSGTPKKAGEKAVPKNDNPADVQSPNQLDVEKARLQNMSVSQLRTFAQEHGIDLGNKNSKAEIFDHISTALSD